MRANDPCHPAGRCTAAVCRGTVLHTKISKSERNGGRWRLRQNPSCETKRKAFWTACSMVLGCALLRRRRAYGSRLPWDCVLLLVSRASRDPVGLLPNGHLRSCRENAGRRRSFLHFGI